MNVTALIIWPTGGYGLHNVPDEGVQEFTSGILEGGSFESVLVGTSAHGYIDTDGKLKGLPVNAAASYLMVALGTYIDVIVGPMVIFGNERIPDESDVPAELLHFLGIEK